MRQGLQAAVPELDAPQLLTMNDMGMAHGDMAGMSGMSGHNMAAMGAPAAAGAAAADPHAGHTMPAAPPPPQAAKPAAADPHAGHTMPAPAQPPPAPSTPAAADPHAGHNMSGGQMQTDTASMEGMQKHPDSEMGNPLVDNHAMQPMSRLDDPGVGLRGNGRKVLTYSDMRSLFDDPDGRDPGRTIELHLTGHMDRFVWSFDGLKFSSAEPVRLNYGERMRIVLVNDTMMSHPIHLHGMWSDVENDAGEFMVRKHTVDMPPGTKRTYRVRADALGRWAFHCHLLLHMEAGMFREVRVDE